jgi:hypothetical protein
MWPTQALKTALSSKLPERLGWPAYRLVYRKENREPALLLALQRQQQRHIVSEAVAVLRPERFIYPADRLGVHGRATDHTKHRFLERIAKIRASFHGMPPGSDRQGVHRYRSLSLVARTGRLVEVKRVRATSQANWHGD